MSYKEYTVRVWSNGSVTWHNEKGEYHREDGPAIYDEKTGYKEFWLNGIYYTEEDYWKKMKPAQEMTVAQIEKELGRKIKIVKESK